MSISIIYISYMYIFITNQLLINVTMQLFHVRQFF